MPPRPAPPHILAKADPAPDAEFYAQPRFVAHIDAAAIAAVTQAYRRTIEPGARVLDLMSSWISHFPPEIPYDATGHGMNARELAANPRLARWFVQDLNQDPDLPLPSGDFGAACLCVSVQYLQRPVEVFQEVARLLRPGAPFIVSFSNRCFPTKAVALWQALDGPDQAALVDAYLRAAGFGATATSHHAPPRADPLWTVIGRAPQPAE